MNWKFWQRKKEVKKETELEQMLRWHEALEKTADVIRVYEYIASRYFFKAQDDPKVKEILREQWISKIGDDTEVWGLLGEFERILDEKFNRYLFNSNSIQRLASSALEARIFIAEAKLDDDGTLRTVREGGTPVNGAPPDTTSQTQ